MRVVVEVAQESAEGWRDSAREWCRNRSSDADPHPPLQVENLNQAHWDAVPASIPVVALAFVYHNVVPVITASLEGDLRRVRTALVVGTSLPSEPRPSLLHSDAHK